MPQHKVGRPAVDRSPQDVPELSSVTKKFFPRGALEKPPDGDDHEKENAKWEGPLGKLIGGGLVVFIGGHGKMRD